MSRRVRRRPSLALVVALVALAIAVGGAALADIPGPDGVIHACYDSRGALQVRQHDASCPPNTTALDWNQTGPQGPPGPAQSNAQEVKQAQESPPARFEEKTSPLSRRVARRVQRQDGAGNDAFSVFRNGPVDVPHYSNDPIHIVASLDVPAGRYVILGKAITDGKGLVNAGVAVCNLQAGGSSDESYAFGGTVASHLVHRFNKPGRVELRCFEFEDNSLLRHIKVTALQVDKLTKTATEF
jgi:hypothetical protein